MSQVIQGNEKPNTPPETGHVTTTGDIERDAGTQLGNKSPPFMLKVMDAPLDGSQPKMVVELQGLGDQWPYALKGLSTLENKTARIYELTWDNMRSTFYTIHKRTTAAIATHIVERHPGISKKAFQHLGAENGKYQITTYNNIKAQATLDIGSLSSQLSLMTGDKTPSGWIFSPTALIKVDDKNEKTECLILNNFLTFAQDSGSRVIGAILLDHSEFSLN
jgi:hypothetical protein